MIRIAAIAIALLVLLSGPAQAQSAAQLHEQAVARLTADLARLDADPSLGNLAGLDRLRARQAIGAAAEARRADREHSVQVARIRLQAAGFAAEAELLAEQSSQLDRERDQIMLESSRREAERARRESERLRLKGLAQEEAAERQVAAQTIALEAAGAETAQARKLAGARAREAELARREAELLAAIAADEITDAAPPPARNVGGRQVHTLDGSAFASGSANLTAPAQASLRALARQLGGGGAIIIEGHTDSQGAAASNLALSQRRAEAVRRLLEDAGLPGSRLTATGKGQSSPVADNGTADGRARNRRVEIIVN